jgi:hypothetical protein
LSESLAAAAAATPPATAAPVAAAPTADSTPESLGAVTVGDRGD